MRRPWPSATSPSTPRDALHDPAGAATPAPPAAARRHVHLVGGWVSTAGTTRTTQRTSPTRWGRSRARFIGAPGRAMECQCDAPRQTAGRARARRASGSRLQYRPPAPCMERLLGCEAISAVPALAPLGRWRRPVCRVTRAPGLQGGVDGLQDLAPDGPPAGPSCSSSITRCPRSARKPSNVRNAHEPMLPPVTLSP